MGTHHGSDGGSLPPDGDHQPDDPHGLPELPPEWGEIRIPDDASELAAEAEQVRRELAERRHEPSARSKPAGGAGASGEAEPSAAIPLLIMSVAVLVTLVSLFAMTWSGSGTPDATTSVPESDLGEVLPGVPLVDAAGRPVSLTAHAPLVLLLVEECADCGELVAATASAAPAAVAVAAVGRSAPEWPPELDPGAGPAPLLLADPDQSLRTALELGTPANAATVILVDQDGRVVRTVPAATAVSQFQADLTELAG